MNERAPVTTVDELLTLNDAEIVEGYNDGYRGEPEPGGNRSKSYWHGWRNGRVDGKHDPKDAAMALLAHQIVRDPRTGISVGRK